MSSVPLKIKTPVTIVVLSSDNEAQALRAVLEGFNFRVDVLWIGSKAEFIEVLKSNIETHKYLVLSCHGDEHGIIVSGEGPISSDEISSVANLQGKTIVNLGCITGSEEYKKAFIDNGKAEAYVAPSDYPEGSTALLFGINVFYQLSRNTAIEEVFNNAISKDSEASIFKLYR